MRQLALLGEEAKHGRLGTDHQNYLSVAPLHATGTWNVRKQEYKHHWKRNRDKWDTPSPTGSFGGIFANPCQQLVPRWLSQRPNQMREPSLMVLSSTLLVAFFFSFSFWYRVRSERSLASSLVEAKAGLVQFPSSSLTGVFLHSGGKKKSTTSFRHEDSSDLRSRKDNSFRSKHS